MLVEYFNESCILPEGDDIDDEDFKIRINFKLFEKSTYSPTESLAVTGNENYLDVFQRMLYILNCICYYVLNKKVGSLDHN